MPVGIPGTPGGRLIRGFTLVELLVVIAIIGVLISSLLPAISASRETARQVQCASNMRQQGIAVWSYASDWRQYGPVSSTADASTEWMVRLASYFGSSASLGDVDMNQQVSSNFNRTTARPFYAPVVLKVLQCPSTYRRLPAFNGFNSYSPNKYYTASDPGTASNWKRFAYAFPLSRAEVQRRMDKFMLFGESRTGGQIIWGWSDNRGLDEVIHVQTFNYVLGDGHVEGVKRTEANFMMTYDADLRPGTGATGGGGANGNANGGTELWGRVNNGLGIYQ